MDKELRGYLIIANFVLIIFWGMVFLCEKPRTPVVYVLGEGNDSAIFAFMEKQNSVLEDMFEKFSKGEK